MSNEMKTKRRPDGLPTYVNDLPFPVTGHTRYFWQASRKWREGFKWGCPRIDYTEVDLLVHKNKLLRTNFLSDNLNAQLAAAQMAFRNAGYATLVWQNPVTDLQLLYVSPEEYQMKTFGRKHIVLGELDNSVRHSLALLTRRCTLHSADYFRMMYQLVEQGFIRD